MHFSIILNYIIFLQKFSDNQIDSFLKQTAPARIIIDIRIVERGIDE